MEAQGAARGWGGWVLFASVVMVIMGFANLFQGLAALINDKYYVITERNLLVFDFTTWGWILLIWGIVLMLVGVALGARQSWARWVAIVLVAFNIVAQFGFLAAFPLWTLVLIGLDVMILYTLTARWHEVKGQS